MYNLLDTKNKNKMKKPKANNKIIDFFNDISYILLLFVSFVLLVFLSITEEDKALKNKIITQEWEISLKAFEHFDWLYQNTNEILNFSKSLSGEYDSIILYDKKWNIAYKSLNSNSNKNQVTSDYLWSIFVKNESYYSNGEILSYLNFKHWEKLAVIGKVNEQFKIELWKNHSIRLAFILAIAWLVYIAYFKFFVKRLITSNKYLKI